MSEPARTDRLGVTRLDHFFSNHGWLFREQLWHDFGIDAQVEIVEEGVPTGNLIAIQIKSGKSYFSEQTDTAFVFRTDDKHIEYWSKHSLPVILVLYNPESDTLYWETVSENTVSSTGSGWRINVPKTQVLSDGSFAALRTLTQPPSYIRRLNKLRLDRPWIDLVVQGDVVYVEFDVWINKSLPRIAVKIGCDTRDDVEKHAWPTAYGPGLSFEELLAHLIPWASFEVDEDAYREGMESRWMNECYGGHEEDGDIYYTKPFEDYYKPPEGIVPVESDGETESYRLILSLNEMGRAFLALDDYLADNDDLEEGVFTLD